jgi:hypothetical protein
MTVAKWRNLLLLSAFVAGGIALYLFNSYTSALHWDHDLYAREFFSVNGIQVSRVIGSKQWHSSSDSAFACSFAIVELRPESTVSLLAKRSKPTSEDSPHSSKFNENGEFDTREWQSTPISKEETLRTCRGLPRECCLNELGAADAAVIMKGLNAPGGWVTSGTEITNFFFPEQNIIGTIRYGD